MTDPVLHLRCPNCKDTDLVFASKAKNWVCPFCWHGAKSGEEMVCGINSTFEPESVREVKEKIEYREPISFSKWIKVTEDRPKYNEIVWGWFKNRKVCLVQHSLSSDEEYFKHCEDGIWYSLDDEKTKCVSHWMPLERPGTPND